MEWNLTMLGVHLVALVLSMLLYRAAPCWMQRLVVVGLSVAFAVMVGAYIAALAGDWWWWYLAVLALTIEHLAVLLYLFRVVWQGGIGWNKSSLRSRSLPSS